MLWKIIDDCINSTKGRKYIKQMTITMDYHSTNREGGRRWYHSTDFPLQHLNILNQQ